jgi:plasmid maintenance system antidote protein VapI
MKPYSIHVGSLVRAELSRRHQTVTWLADQLGIQRTNCYRILSAQSVHTAMLERLSIAMQHDFFADCTSQINQRSK